MTKQTKCRHRKTWAVAFGLVEWCYQCGALRFMRPVNGLNDVAPDSPWAIPSGPHGANPWCKSFDGTERP